LSLLEGSNPSPSASTTSMNDAALATELLALGAATLGESGGRSMRARIRAAWQGATVAAPAFPVRCTPGDNLAIHVAVAEAPAGCALVVDVGIQRELGYWGEVLTTGAQARGIAGLVIDGGVRDVAALERLAFPVFSALVALPGATKKLPGTVGARVVVGDVDLGQGDWIVGDRDGVTVIPADSLPDVLAAGRSRAAKEQQLFTELRVGKTTLELLDLDDSPIERH
jgi:4-hydroxy-4-methyl-2-oxoglutarate aldolase